MVKFNQGGQWSLTGDEEHLLFKTGEQKSSGKTELIERRKVDPNSEEAGEIFNRLAKAIIAGRPKQPTNEEMFGHLVLTEEQIQKAEYEWENKIRLGYEEALKPIEAEQDNSSWGLRKSFKEQLTEEELRKYLEEEKQFDKKHR